jgi:hypothetical protein
MILRIDDNKSIADLQDKFEQCFPGLKIEFYYRSHNWLEDTLSKFQVPSDCLVGDIRNIHSQGILEIKSWFLKGKVEQDFKELFDLNVQIFRFKNHKWEHTIKSDQLTLAQLIGKPDEKEIFFRASSR